MLQAKPTMNGTGVGIYGDFGDLNSLYETVHDVAKTLDAEYIKTKGQYQILMIFAYEIRKAFTGDRLIEKVKVKDQEMLYCGFQCVWTDILIYISVLRLNAGYIQTDKLQQANLYLLEYVIEKAMFEYDPDGAYEIINHNINVNNPYVFVLSQNLHMRFITEKLGVKRFRNIPIFLDEHFSEGSQDYKDLIISFKYNAKDRNCDITELEIENYPEIKW